MTLKELLDLDLVHDNVKILNWNTDPDLDYLFKATKIFSRSAKAEDFKFNKDNGPNVSQHIEDYFSREVESITGAKQAYMTLIFLK